MKSFPGGKCGTREPLKTLLRFSKPDLFHSEIQLLKIDGIFISSNSLIHQITKARSFLLVFDGMWVAGLYIKKRVFNDLV